MENDTYQRTSCKMNPNGKSYFQYATSLDVTKLLSPAAINFMKESSSIHLTVLRNLERFKKFDTVIETADHHFVSEYSSTSKKWARLIKEERGILKNNLPKSIFIRAYESRLDLLRAVFVGRRGTPYINGLFFFDIYFPTEYPNKAPLIYCHAKDCERLSPLFDSKSRLTLGRIKIWPNSNQECWVPGVTNVLDVLVSIRKLVFNARPFFNQFPGDPGRTSIPHFVIVSRLYNENVFTLTQLMMSSTMEKPPKYFEDFVVGHFVLQAHEILSTCNAFIEDCEPYDVLLEETVVANIWPHAESVSRVRKLINRLVLEFSRIGATDCEKFLTPEIINAGRSLYVYYEEHNFFKV